MSKILQNQQPFDVPIPDTGVTVAASSSYVIPPQDYATFAASSDVITLIADLTFILNDGGNDITNISNAIDIIKGWPVQASGAEEPFFFDYSGEIIGASPFTLISHLVTTATLSLSRLEISCRTESAIQVLLNGVPIADLRTGAAKPSTSFNWFPKRECILGDIIDVVLNKRVSSPDIDVGAHLMGVTTT